MSGNIFVLCVLAVALVAPMANAAVVAKKIPAKEVFYPPSSYSLYYYPGFEFALAACGPRDDDFRFGVSFDATQKAYLVKYTWVPFDTQNQAQFQAIRSITLNLKTGVISFTSYGSSISVNLKTYLKTDRLQSTSTTFGSKTVWGQDLYIQDPVANKASPVLVDLDKPVAEALRVLSNAARTFAKTSVPYQCREKTTTPGHATLRNLSAYLSLLRSLLSARW